MPFSLCGVVGGVRASDAVELLPVFMLFDTLENILRFGNEWPVDWLNSSSRLFCFLFNDGFPLSDLDFFQIDKKKQKINTLVIDLIYHSQVSNHR